MSEPSSQPFVPPALAIGRDKLFGHLAMILFASLIAGSFTLGKLAIAHAGAAPINSARFISAAVILAVFTFGFQKHPFRLPVQPWRYLILGGLMGYYFLSMFKALELTTPVSTSAVFTLTPVLTAIIGYVLLRQGVKPFTLLSLLFAGTGALWVIFRADINALLAFQVGTGEWIFFSGCIAHAFFALLLPRFNRGETLAYSTLGIVMGNAIWITLYGLPEILQTDWLNLPPIVWITIAFLAIFPSAITFALMGFAARRLPPTKVMSYGYLVPSFVIIYEGVAGHGWTSGLVVLGAIVTCLGLVVLYFSPDN